MSENVGKKYEFLEEVMVFGDAIVSMAMRVSLVMPKLEITHASMGMQ